MKKYGILTLLACIVAVLAVAGAGCTGTTTEPDYVVGIDGAADADSHRLRVDVRPLEGERFGAAHAGVGDESPQREQFVFQLVAVPGEEQG